MLSTAGVELPQLVMHHCCAMYWGGGVLAILLSHSSERFALVQEWCTEYITALWELQVHTGSHCILQYQIPMP